MPSPAGEHEIWKMLHWSWWPPWNDWLLPPSAELPAQPKKIPVFPWHLERTLPLSDPLSTLGFYLGLLRHTFGDEEVLDDLIVYFDIGESEDDVVGDFMLVGSS